MGKRSWGATRPYRLKNVTAEKRAWIDLRAEIELIIVEAGGLDPLIIKEYFVRWARLVRMRGKFGLRAHVLAKRGVEGQPITRLDEVLSDEFKRIEGEFRKILRVIQKHSSSGRWLASQTGVGPISTVGLESFVDISRCEHVSSLWQFVGLGSPKKTWNGLMRTCMHQLGDSIIVNQNLPDCYYGQLYRLCRETVNQKNEEGRYSHIAKTLPGVEDGKVWSVVLRNIARKEMLRILVSHYHAVRKMSETGRLPSIPYSATVKEDVDLVPIPNSFGAPELGGMIAQYNARLADAGRIVLLSPIATYIS